MRKYLLPEKGKFYKANLHTHTTISDGKRTPEEIKEAYMAEGYSIVAYSDHEIMLPHNDLTDENFLAITAVEYIVNEPDVNNLGFLSMKTYHINLYAKDSEATVSPGFCEKIIWRKNTLPLVTDEMRQKQDSARYYGAEYVNDVIRRANEQGFLVCYCHPVWSLQNYEDYSGLKGLWGGGGV